MGKIYVSAFLLPTPVEKHLADDGWEFKSPARLPEQTIEALRLGLGVRHTETYPGADVWEGEGLKASVLRDEAGAIEEVYVQLFSRQPDELRGALDVAGLDSIEVFVPAG